MCGSTVNALVVFSGSDVEPGTTTSVGTTVAWSYSSATRQVVRTSCRASGSADIRTLARNVSAAPAVSASCSAVVSVTSQPKPLEVGLTVPQGTGAPLKLCATRRPE